eukprot:364115-Chlamydomonas_euryale.AAC.4
MHPRTTPLAPRDIPYCGLFSSRFWSGIKVLIHSTTGGAAARPVAAVCPSMSTLTAVAAPGHDSVERRWNALARSHRENRWRRGRLAAASFSQHQHLSSYTIYRLAHFLCRLSSDLQ